MNLYHMKPKIIVLVLLGLLFTGNAIAQTSYQFSLQQAIEFAYQNQNDIKNAQLDAEISKSKVKETVAIGLPQISGSANLQHFIDIPTQLIPNFISPLTGAAPGTYPEFIEAQFGTNYNSSYGISVNQLLFDGSYLIGLKASSVYKDLTVKALARTKIETNVAVTKAYYSVLVNRERLSLLDANIVRLKKTLSDTKAYYENGFAEKVDYDRLSVLYNNLTTERENISRLVDLSLSLLKFQIGMNINNELTLTDKLESIQLQALVESNQVLTAEERIEYQLLKTSMKLNELDYKRNIVTNAPSLVAFGSFSRNFLNNDFGTLFDRSFPTSVVGLQLNVPITGSGKKYHQTKQAKLTLEKSKNDLSNLENALNLQSRQSQINYNNSVRSLENQRKNMDLAKEVLRVSKAKYDQGIGSSLEVTTAETSLKEAETNYISSLYDALIAKVELDKAFGKIQ
jgi:outer membrane protein